MKNKIMLSFASAMTVAVVGYGNITKIVYQATGWTMPTWLAWTLIGIGSVSLIISAIATCGVTIPAAVGYAVLGASSVAL